LAKLGTRAPISGRLALRDLGRYQARSGAALAAISLALGIPSAVVATAAAAENNIGLGNLSASQLMVRPEDLDGPFVVDPGKIDHLRAGVDALAKALPDATVIPLDAARDPKDTAKPGLPGLTGVSIGKPTKDGFFDVGLVFVATPELLAMYGLDESDIADADVITSDTGDLRIFASVTADAIDRNNLERVASPGSLPTSYSALPHALVSSARLQAHGWISVPSGRWLIDTKQPLTAAQLSNARQIATQYGLTVESRDDQQGLVNLRRGAVTIGMVLALAILAMTIGLIRSESSGDLRTLTASGATGSTRRNISAVTAGGLALLGAVLGIVGAYIGLAAGHLSDLTPVPLRDLLIIVVGTPLVAAAAGWVLAGREPAVLARRPIE
jgi:putative ABC transport system permease protein